MSEILLQTLVEKITAFQTQVEEMQVLIRTAPDHTAAFQQVIQRIVEVQVEVKAVPEKISIPEAMLVALRGELRLLTAQLQMPLRKEVRHLHHINRMVIVCIALTGAMVVLFAFLMLTRAEIRQHSDADIKYRYLKLSGPGMVRDLQELDSLYQLDPDRMQKDVEKEERRRQKLFEASQRIEDNKKEIEELQDDRKEGKSGSLKWSEQ